MVSKDGLALAPIFQVLGITVCHVWVSLVSIIIIITQNQVFLSRFTCEIWFTECQGVALQVPSHSQLVVILVTRARSISQVYLPTVLEIANNSFPLLYELNFIDLMIYFTLD